MNDEFLNKIAKAVNIIDVIIVILFMISLSITMVTDLDVAGNIFAVLLIWIFPVLFSAGWALERLNF